MRRGAERLGRSLQQLLDLTRICIGTGTGLPLSPEPVDLQELCRQAVEEHRAAQPGRDLRLGVRGDASVAGDAPRLTQVVNILLGNALRHGSPDGPVRVNLVGEGAEVVLMVHNQGPPIERELLPRLFQPVRREASHGHGPSGSSSDSRGGIGGLSLCILAAIVRGHGGTVTARSSAQEGTTFTVHLPR